MEQDNHNYGDYGNDDLDINVQYTMQNHAQVQVYLLGNKNISSALHLS